jgi:LPXTG-site transpeptidase (sortase) family protein
MTAVPRQTGRRAATGLVLTIAAACLVLAGESSAGAAIGTHSSHPQRATAKRDIWHERLLRDIRNPRAVRQPSAHRAARRPPARRPGKAARPWTVAIPSIGVDTNVMALGGPYGGAGLDGLSLPVPPLAKAASEAGWYKFTAVPGAAGNAVIVGHVDTYVGPAVFYNLYQLRPGDSVYVDANGARRRFEVTSVRELPKPNFPVNQVFGGTTRHMLWLITCGGAFDYKTGHYLSNIVVSAAWVPPMKNHQGEKEHAKRPENHQESIR